MLLLQPNRMCGFCRKNKDLTDELRNRKLKYNEILIAKVNEEPIRFLILE